jgi:hypothetical protein
VFAYTFWYIWTMLPKKGPALARMPSPPRGVRRELENLYTRHAAIDRLIESLEAYDRFRVRRLEESKQKTA